MAAVVVAQQAGLDHEPGGREALRGALVDMASIAELLADELE